MIDHKEFAEQELILEDQLLVLTTHRAIYWPARKALIISDVHVGKTGHFRKHGIAIPNSLLLKDLDRLERLLHFYNIEELIIVGDLFHASFNKDITLFQVWREKFKHISFVLVKGNHDRLSRKLYENLNIEIYDKELMRYPFLFKHDLVTDNTIFTISGHIHPGVQLKLNSKQRVKLPCYVLADKALILPAFSLFTGFNTQKIALTKETYAFTDTHFFRIKTA